MSRFFIIGTNIFKRGRTLLASWGLCAANVAPEVNKAVAGIGLVFLRDSIGEYALDLDGILQLLGIKSESAAYSYTMSIGNNAGDAENVAEEEVGDLSSDTGEFAELICVARQFTAVFVAELDASRLD